MTLTSDQQLTIKRLIPKIRKFLSYQCSDKFLTEALSEALRSGSVGGIVKIEYFTLGNTEGIRVQEGFHHEYFVVEKR